MPYRLSSRAEQDLDEVWLYVAADASPTAADRLIRRMAVLIARCCMAVRSGRGVD